MVGAMVGVVGAWEGVVGALEGVVGALEGVVGAWEGVVGAWKGAEEAAVEEGGSEAVGEDRRRREGFGRERSRGWSPSS